MTSLLYVCSLIFTHPVLCSTVAWRSFLRGTGIWCGIQPWIKPANLPCTGLGHSFSILTTKSRRGQNDPERVWKYNWWSRASVWQPQGRACSGLCAVTVRMDLVSEGDTGTYWKTKHQFVHVWGWMGLEGRQVSSYGRNQQVLRRDKVSCWAHSRVRGEVVGNDLRGALQKVLALVQKNFCKLFPLKNCCYTHDGTKTELKWGLVSNRYWWNLRLQEVLSKHMQPSILPSLLQPPKILKMSEFYPAWIHSIWIEHK